jgi:hypothetical protein
MAQNIKFSLQLDAPWLPLLSPLGLANGRLSSCCCFTMLHKSLWKKYPMYVPFWGSLALLASNICLWCFGNDNPQAIQLDLDSARSPSIPSLLTISLSDKNALSNSYQDLWFLHCLTHIKTYDSCFAVILIVIVAWGDIGLHLACLAKNRKVGSLFLSIQ